MVQTSPFHKALVGLPELIPSLTTALPGLLASSDRPGALELLYFTLAGRPELLPMCRDLLSPSVIADLCDDLASSDSDPRKVVVWLSLVMLIADQTWWAVGSNQVAYEIPEWYGAHWFFLMTLAGWASGDTRRPLCPLYSSCRFLNGVIWR